MRERSTWNRHEIAKIAAHKQAAEVAGDIYSMNQEHPQPKMDDYVIGGPSDFAEEITKPNTWEAEYSGEQVERNEIGMPEMRSDTFSHAEKTAADRVRLKKAELCVAVAKLMLSGKKMASTDVLEDQAYALMYLPDQELINTHKRLASEQEESDDDSDDDDSDDDDSDDSDGDEDGGETQDKQAGEVPPQFKENVEKMKAKSMKDDEDDDDGEKKQAGDSQMPDFIKKKIEDKEEDDGEAKKAASKFNDRGFSAATEQLAQMQQMMAQMQQMQQMLQQAQQVQQMPAQQMPVEAQDDLDQLLASDVGGPMAEVDIEMEPPQMDLDNVVLAGEDHILRSLFAQEDEQVDDAQVEDAQAQQKQAAVRTASTRTVGTRPSVGVAKLGGSVSKTASVAVDSLSSLWPSAPDVRESFGLK